MHLLDKPKPVLLDDPGRHRPGDPGQHLHQRSAHQARLRAPGGARHHRGPRDGGRGGGGGPRPSRTVRPGDRVAVNVETFCGECFFCRHGWVNNCTDPNGGWALGCRIDGGQAEYVRVPYADQGLTKIPDSVYRSARPCLWGTSWPPATGPRRHLGDHAGGHGAHHRGRPHGPVHSPVRAAERAQDRSSSASRTPGAWPSSGQHYPQVLVVAPERLGGIRRRPTAPTAAPTRCWRWPAAEDTFRMAWECARPNAVVTVVALYDAPQTLPLPEMYGKNLTFKTGGVDGCHCGEILDLIAAGKAGHHAPDHPHLPPPGDRRGLRAL